MAHTSITIVLELDQAVDSLVGRACLPDGTCRMFHGWLGLTEAIDSLAAIAARGEGASVEALRRSERDHGRARQS